MMHFREYPPAARDVVLSPLRAAVDKRRAEIATLYPAGALRESPDADRRAALLSDIAVLTAALACLESGA